MGSNDRRPNQFGFPVVELQKFKPLFLDAKLPYVAVCPSLGHSFTFLPKYPNIALNCVMIQISFLSESLISAHLFV